MTGNKKRNIYWVNHNSKVQIISQVGSIFTFHFFGIKSSLMANIIVDTVLRLPERNDK